MHRFFERYRKFVPITRPKSELEKMIAEVNDTDKQNLVVDIQDKANETAIAFGPSRPILFIPNEGSKTGAQ